MCAGGFRPEPEDESRCSSVQRIGNVQEMSCAFVTADKKTREWPMMVVRGFIQKLFTLE